MRIRRSKEEPAMGGRILTSLALLILWATAAQAFDHQRKGFVLGLGGGIAPYASLRSLDLLSTSTSAPVDETSAGFAYQFVIGYAWNERDWLVYEGNVLDRHSDAYDTAYYQGTNGVSWYHAFGPRGASWITAVGAGWEIVSTGDYFLISINGPALPAGPPTDDGFGALLGIGYEFHPRWLVMAYGGAGATSDWETDFRQSNVSAMLQYLWD